MYSDDVQEKRISRAGDVVNVLDCALCENHLVIRAIDRIGPSHVRTSDVCSS